MIQLQEFTSVADMMAHRKAVRARLKMDAPPPRIATVRKIDGAAPAPVPEPEPAPIERIERSAPEVPPPADTVDEWSAVTVKRIVATVAAAYHVREIEIVSKRRGKDVVLPRQVCAWLARRFTRQSLPQIALRLGGRDHTTIMYSVAKIEELRHTNGALARTLQEIEDALLDGRPPSELLAMPVWRSVPLYPRFEASSHGEIRHRDTGEMLPQILQRGVPKVSFRLDGQYPNRSVRDIVARTFIGPRPHGYECVNKDGNPQNNHAANLAYVEGVREEAEPLLTPVEEAELVRRVECGEISKAHAAEIYGVTTVKVNDLCRPTRTRARSASAHQQPKGDTLSDPGEISEGRG